MKFFFGSANTVKDIDPSIKQVLLNFFVDNTCTFDFYKGCDVICDSGTFSFMVNPKKMKGVNIEEYCDRYCERINKYRIKHFFEMDVDTLMGAEKVLELRKRIEAKAFHVPIPVWHCERGKKGWEDMCDNYNYVALPLSGKNATSQWLKQDGYKRLWWFVDEAHKRGVRIHALGLGENSTLYRKGAFYSCDSVAWTFVSRSRTYAVFYPREGRWRRQRYRDGYRYDYVKARALGISQWRLFHDWAEESL